MKLALARAILSKASGTNPNPKPDLETIARMPFSWLSAVHRKEPLLLQPNLKLNPNPYCNHNTQSNPNPNPDPNPCERISHSWGQW